MNDEGFYKAMGATAILVAALTIMMPIFHRLSRGDLIGEKGSISDDQYLFSTVLCRKCGTRQPFFYSDRIYQLWLFRGHMISESSATL